MSERAFFKVRYYGVLFFLLFAFFARVENTGAQEAPRPADGWQGPRPTPQASSPSSAPQSPLIPGPQRSGPSGKQVLEIPPHSQAPLPPPAKQQAIIPPASQQSTLPRTTQPVSSRPSQMLTVTVTDRDGRYIPDLRPEDFIVYEEDLPQSLTYFNTGQNEPMSLGLIVDMSESMLRKMGRARQALYLLADTIQSRDEVFLAAFNFTPILLQDFTDSRALVLQATAQLQPDGQTALYDAILDGLHRIQKGRCQKKALVVLTDGVDTASRASLNEVQAAIHGTNVLVYTIGIGNPNNVRVHGGRPMGLIGPMGGFTGGYGPPMAPPGQLIDETVDTQTLQAISEETGAKHFLLNTADVLGNGATLERAASTIVTELRQQYSLGYRSPLKGDVYRDVRVETRRAGVIVRTQKGID